MCSRALRNVTVLYGSTGGIASDHGSGSIRHSSGKHTWRAEHVLGGETGVIGVGMHVGTSGRLVWGLGGKMGGVGSRS